MRECSIPFRLEISGNFEYIFLFRGIVSQGSSIKSFCCGRRHITCAFCCCCCCLLKNQNLFKVFSDRYLISKHLFHSLFRQVLVRQTSRTELEWNGTLPCRRTRKIPFAKIERSSGGASFLLIRLFLCRER